MLLSKIIEKKFDEVLGRYNGNPAIRYPSLADFPELQRKNFDIVGEHQVNLKGYFYYYNKISANQLVVFDHGIDAGHMAYLAEIDYLARNGYTVYSYDHTGCVDSGGEGILGFAQGINDLDHVLTALHRDPDFVDSTFMVVGHSWGAYSAMNVAALHPEVTHIVSLAGFLSAEALIRQYIPKIFHHYTKEVMERERFHNPLYADMDARDSIKKSSAKLFHIQSKDDSMVKYDLCYIPLFEALNGRKDTVLISTNHKNHNPQRTLEATAADICMKKQLHRLTKKKQLSPEEKKAFRKSQDWNKIVQQDSEVWKQILDFLKK